MSKASGDRREPEAMTLPEKLRLGSDQRRGEETVQVNDAYAGGQPPPDQEPYLSNDQHQTPG